MGGGALIPCQIMTGTVLESIPVACLYMWQRAEFIESSYPYTRVIRYTKVNTNYYTFNNIFALHILHDIDDYSLYFHQAEMLHLIVVW
jgi:hypothetical protein